MSAQTPETFGFQAEISQLLVSRLVPFVAGGAWMLQDPARDRAK